MKFIVHKVFFQMSILIDFIVCSNCYREWRTLSPNTNSPFFQLFTFTSCIFYGTVFFLFFFLQKLIFDSRRPPSRARDHVTRYIRPLIHLKQNTSNEPKKQSSHKQMEQIFCIFDAFVEFAVFSSFSFICTMV